MDFSIIEGLTDEELIGLYDEAVKDNDMLSGTVYFRIKCDNGYTLTVCYGSAYGGCLSNVRCGYSLWSTVGYCGYETGWMWEEKVKYCGSYYAQACILSCR